MTTPWDLIGIDKATYDYRLKKIAEFDGREEAKAPRSTIQTIHLTAGEVDEARAEGIDLQTAARRKLAKMQKEQK